MSALMTKIHLRGWHGMADWGKKSPRQMIAWARRVARHDKQEAEKILAAKDEDFEIYICNGHIVERNVRILQVGKNPKKTGRAI